MTRDNTAVSEPLFNGGLTSKQLTIQLRLLNRCAQLKEPLEYLLQASGMSYEDLRYEFHEPVKKTSAMLYKNLSQFTVDPHGVPVISFFSGAGGVDLGFEAAGFQHHALVEVNRLFCDTLRRNRPKWQIIGPPDCSGDVSNKDELFSQIGRVLGTDKPFEGIFVGGPPCQSFSIAANQRFSKSGDNFKRIGYAHKTNGNLLFDFIDVIKRFRPAAFLIENVTGLADIDGGAQLREALSSLQSSGYSVESPMVINAMHYHVPQQRIRLFIVGNRRKRQFSMPPLASRIIPCSAVFSMSTKGLRNHETRKHKPESILRYMRLRYGQRDQLGRVDRLNPYHPSKTVIAGGTAGGGRSHLHPIIPRTISVREGARLQTFPDDYIFEGPSARQFTQVGNAVPPVLAAQLANALKKSFFS